MKKPNIAALNAQDSADYWKRKYEKLKEEFDKYHKDTVAAMMMAYNEGKNSNGCDCGQPSCAICHG